MAEKKSKEKRPSFIEFLYTENDFNEFLAVIEKKTSVQREYIFAAVVAATLLSLLIGYGTQFVTTLVAIVYPCYQTVMVLMGDRKNDVQSVQWLIYWVIYAVFSLAECFVDAICKVFPFYYATKIVLLCWCMAPIDDNGCNVLYKTFFKKEGKTKSS